MGECEGGQLCQQDQRSCERVHQRHQRCPCSLADGSRQVPPHEFQESMLGKGVLQVDKVSNHAGNFVFINGRAVGLSNKLNDFESIAVRMAKYESTLAKLTAHLSGKRKINV